MSLQPWAYDCQRSRNMKQDVERRKQQQKKTEFKHREQDSNLRPPDLREREN